MKLGIAGLTAVLLMSGGLGLFPAAAQTGPSYNGGNCPGGNTCTTWCPGEPAIPGSEFGVISWDWNVCHDWYWNSEGVVDIAANVVYPWHGAPHDNGPVPAPLLPAQPLPADCPPWSPILAPSRCGGL